MNKNISITLNITRVFSHSYAQKLFYTVESPLEKKNTRYGHSTFKQYPMIWQQIYSMNAIDWQESNGVDN